MTCSSALLLPISGGSGEAMDERRNPAKNAIDKR